MQVYVELPAGYRMIAENDLNIAVKEGYDETFKGFVMPEVFRDHDGGAVRHGRSELASFPLEGSNERMLVRRCVRGGILGRCVKELHLNWGTPRPLEELKISEYARARSIPTPEILAAAFERVRPIFYKGAVAVREISPSADLQAELIRARHPLDNRSLNKKRFTISSLGHLIARMHAAGIYHADLHLKNVLASGTGDHPELYLLDLDAAKTYNRLSDFRRCLNLLRLYRSVAKVNRLRRVVTRTDVLRFLRSYAEESQRSWKKLAEKLGRMMPLWNLKWKISDTLGV